MEEKNVWPAATWWPASFVVASGEWVWRRSDVVCVWRRGENRKEESRCGLVVGWGVRAVGMGGKGIGITKMGLI